MHSIPGEGGGRGGTQRGSTPAGAGPTVTHQEPGHRCQLRGDCVWGQQVCPSPREGELDARLVLRDDLHALMLMCVPRLWQVNLQVRGCRRMHCMQSRSLLARWGAACKRPTCPNAVLAPVAAAQRALQGC